MGDEVYLICHTCKKYVCIGQRWRNLLHFGVPNNKDLKEMTKKPCKEEYMETIIGLFFLFHHQNHFIDDLWDSNVEKLMGLTKHYEDERVKE